jgi:hypothetical protein
MERNFDDSSAVGNRQVQEIMMRIAYIALLLAAVVSSPAHARGNVTKFEGVQEQCAKVGKIKFGAKAKWSECSVTKGRWFATLDFIDMYQAQYCLGKGDGECDKRALLVFGNRAYTPNAKLILERIDPGTAKYDDPVLVQTKYGDILTLSAHLPDGSASNSYYRWHSGRWIPVEAKGWLRELSRQLPKGQTIKADVWPDADSMSAQATLYSAGGSGASDKVAEVDLALINDRFTVKKVTLTQKTN